jgi:hypothetical protein
MAELFDLLEVDVFPHGIFWVSRLRLFRRRPALLLGIGALERIVVVLGILLHIPELLANLPGSPENGQEEIKDEFVQQVQYYPQ